MNRSIIDDKRSNEMQLNVEELQRYSRHLIMPEVTSEGQNRLKAARVFAFQRHLDRLAQSRELRRRELIDALSDL